MFLSVTQLLKKRLGYDRSTGMFNVQKLDLLIALYIFCIAVSELMGAKTFHLISIGSLHINPSVAIFVVPLIFTINDIIFEVYGKERAQSVVRSGLVMIFLFMLFAVLAINLPPSGRFAESENAYDAIFAKSIRISAASLTAFGIALFLDVAIFARIKKRLGKKSLWLRNNVSNFGAQFFDTVIFMSLAFYALDRSFNDNAAFLVGLILPYWLLKCAMSVIETPFVYLGVKWLRKDKTLK